MKTNQKTRCKNNSGTAVITVLGLVTLISMASGYMAYTASQEMHMSRVLRESLKAKMIAESGLNTAYHLLTSDFSKAAGLRLESAFDTGKYVVTSVPDPNSVNRYQLISNGTCGSYGHFKVAADVENRPTITHDTTTGRTYEFVYDILIGGIMDLKGNFDALVDKIHANGSIYSKGSSFISAITISSTGTITLKNCSGTSTILQNQPAVSIQPQELTAAINALKAYAEKNGAKYANSADVPANPPGGVAWCTGGGRWKNGGTGCFIFDGDVYMQGGGRTTYESVDGYPALILLGTGQVKINAQTVVNGAIIVPNGSIFLVGTADFYGPILVGQGLTGSGTAAVHAGNGQSFNLPPDETITDKVIISAWH